MPCHIQHFLAVKTRLMRLMIQRFMAPSMMRMALPGLSSIALRFCRSSAVRSADYWPFDAAVRETIRERSRSFSKRLERFVDPGSQQQDGPRSRYKP